MELLSWHNPVPNRIKQASSGADRYFSVASPDGVSTGGGVEVGRAGPRRPTSHSELNTTAGKNWPCNLSDTRGG